MDSVPGLHLRESLDIDIVVAALHEADEDDNRIRAIVSDSVTTPYEIVIAGKRIGAAAVQWHPDQSELVYMALDVQCRGQGLGKAVITALSDEARRRGVKSLLVGTSNSSLGTIAFYQKCGFRMDSVRRDYFQYFAEPVYENGIRIRDMLVLRLVIE